MQIDLIPVEKFIKLNKLQEITNPVIFEKGSIPTTDGLLSTDIFGVSTKDRKDTYAYISLNGHFLHPFIYKMLKRMNRKFEAIVNGTKNFIIDEEGKLVEQEDGSTGLEYLYKNWEKIKFEKNESRMRSERIDLLSATDKNELFTQYWIIIPAFYRDVNVQIGNKIGGYEEINEFYAKLIRFASMINNTNNFNFVLEITRGKMQQMLEQIYDKLKGKIEKKQGIIKKSLLGKNVDYGAR
jgi:DNA-directed RNA polymerase beta' subunit